MTLKEQLKDVWLAGFSESAEGFNNEYPFNQPGAKTQHHVDLLDAAFEKWWNDSIYVRALGTAAQVDVCFCRPLGASYNPPAPGWYQPAGTCKSPNCCNKR